MIFKSNQELHERIVDHDAQMTDLESANDAKQRRIDELEERFNALTARMDAVENKLLFTHTIQGMRIVVQLCSTSRWQLPKTGNNSS